MNTNIEKQLEANLEKVKNLLLEQLEVAEKRKNAMPATDFTKAEKIIIGCIDGDGIGPTIMQSALAVLNELLKEEIENGKIVLKHIQGLTIENRLACGKTLPDDVLADIKSCDVLLKGPTTTPSKAEGKANIESANVALRRELDLFANVRPINIPEKNINWVFYRENTEGEYALGSKGIDVADDISMDFKVISDVCTKRIARAGFEYAKNNGNLNVSIITKANIMKKTDGRFLNTCMEVAKDYPDIKVDDWFVDICAANLINDDINSNFNVFILPNLYGDIITDEAAQMQGGVGTAGSANIGNQYAMFEAVHGSAPRMIADGLADYANPASLLKALAMLLRHIAMPEVAASLENAIDKATSKLNMAGVKGANTCKEFESEVLNNV